MMGQETRNCVPITESAPNAGVCPDRSCPLDKSPAWLPQSGQARAFLVSSSIPVRGLAHRQLALGDILCAGQSQPHTFTTPPPPSADANNAAITRCHAKVCSGHCVSTAPDSTIPEYASTSFTTWAQASTFTARAERFTRQYPESVEATGMTENAAADRRRAEGGQENAATSPIAPGTNW